MLALTLVNVYSDYKNWKCNHHVHIVQELKNTLIQHVKHCIFYIIAHKYPAEHQQLTTRPISQASVLLTCPCFHLDTYIKLEVCNLM